MTSLFFSYSHRDEALRDQIETHLAMLKRQGFIDTWHDRRILAGEVIDSVISENLERADIVLLLVSSDFLASDYCYDRELKRALERHAAGSATVIPVILRPCDWRDAPFGTLLAVPKDGKPITQWPDIDSAFLDVTTAIKGLLRKRRASPPKPVPIPASPPPIVIEEPRVRSSNLRIVKRFSERDKDIFVEKAFEYIGKFFENSLDELATRNPGVECRFRQIDATRITAVTYRDGDVVGRCKVFVRDRQGFKSGIAYANSDSLSGEAYNEELTVESDEQSLYLRPLGMDRQKLTAEGAAELYWSIFIEPLQRP